MCLVRTEGTNQNLKFAVDNCLKIGAGHVFIIFLRTHFCVLNAIKNVPGMHIYCLPLTKWKLLLRKRLTGEGF